jgi:hypothetical protein
LGRFASYLRLIRRGGEAEGVLAFAPDSISFGSSLGLAFLLLGFALFAGIAALSHDRERAFSSAMIYLGLGAAAGAVVRYGGVGRLASPLHDHEAVKLITDGALVLALFSTGMRIRRGAGAREWELTLRLIVLAMPRSPSRHSGPGG